MTGLVIGGAPILWQSGRALLSRRLASDLVASLAILGAIWFDQPLAGLIIVLMQSGGEALERYAEGRASDAVRSLEQRAPVRTHRVTSGGVEDISVAAILVDDDLLVRPGELVPCDGVVISGRSHLDTSSITGESMPVAALPGTRVASGYLNADSPFTMRATATAGESQYARIVDLVRSAQASKAPIQRLADRYAAWFTPLTLLACAAAWWISGDPHRILAVLVVATPCPLILAAPVAILGGINRGARRGILFLHGSALEQLNRIDVVICDKTGTLTIGEPQVTRLSVLPPFEEREVLRLAATAELGSSHPLARSVVVQAGRRGIELAEAIGLTEASGSGITGMVEGRQVMIGSAGYIRHALPQSSATLDSLGTSQGTGLHAVVAIDGEVAGGITFDDEVRPGVAEFLRRLHAHGVRRIILLSGDSTANAESIARMVGIDEAHGDQLPGDKTAWVERLKAAGHRVLMLGDGTNDAPALAAASVGVALSRGHSGITSESADIVLTSDDPTRLLDALLIAHRTLRIARQSIWTGLGLSVIAMGFAGAGVITPVAGALLQEVIDVAVILNALRASATS
jgi:heavy metal translocating P-type ATPase